MRNLSFVVACCAALAGAVPVAAQCVSYQGYTPSESVNSIGVRVGSGWTENGRDLPPISGAIGLWGSGCSGMTAADYPSLVADQNGSITLTVNYRTGSMPNAQNPDSCVWFDPQRDSAGHVVGGTIDVFQQTYNHGDCLWVTVPATLSHAIAHELGHALGLANTPCSGYLMGPSWPTAGPNSDECGWVDQLWTTQQERDDDCTTRCWTACSGGVCPNHYTLDGCGDDCSPIVLGFNNARYEFTSPLSGTLFDIDADGSLDRVAWVAEPDIVAFLFLDRNGNGAPDNGNELFGNATLLRSGSLASNGFAALQELDSDHDGVLTPSDDDWPKLRLWFDVDRNGKADPFEILTLDEMNVRVLQLTPTWTGRRDRHGNMLRWKAMYKGGANPNAWSPFYDVYLKIAR